PASWSHRVLFGAERDLPSDLSRWKGARPPCAGPMTNRPRLGKDAGPRPRAFPMSDPLVLIPARLAATRLPNKPLADIAGEPMIVHVWRRAVEAGIGPVAV